MEIERKVIHMSLTKANKELMLKLDDDLILADGRSEIVNIIKERGEVVIDRIRGLDDKVMLSGNLCYKILYRTEGGYDSIDGKIPFEEMVPIEGVTPQDIFKCVHYLEDLSVHMVNSRKISIKALVRFNIYAKALKDKEVIGKINSDELQSKTREINIMTLLSSQKDNFRIKEGITLPIAGDVVDKILWYEMEPENMEYRLRDGELGLKGELSFFCIYTTGQGDGLSYYNSKIPFANKIELNNSTEDAYGDININSIEKNLALRADHNGEMKILELEAVLDMDIKSYVEEKSKVLEDAYSPLKNLELTRDKISCEELVMKNSFKCKAEGIFSLPDRDAMQLLNTIGTVYIEDMVGTLDGVVAEGAVIVDVLYQKADRANSIGFGRFKLPFSQKIEGLMHDERYIFSSKTEGLKVTASLMNNEINIKCVMGIDLMITQAIENEVVEDIKEGEFDYNNVKNLPGITGYVVCPGDTLWDIAKRYGTTVSKIMETNNLSSEEIKSGMKILVVK